MALKLFRRISHVINRFVEIARSFVCGKVDAHFQITINCQYHNTVACCFNEYIQILEIALQGTRIYINLSQLHIPLNDKHEYDAMGDIINSFKFD